MFFALRRDNTHPESLRNSAILEKFFGEMEGQQNNVQVSGSQSSNSNVSVRSRRPPAPKFNTDMFDMSVDSDDGHETKPRKGQRGA